MTSGFNEIFTSDMTYITNFRAVQRMAKIMQKMRFCGLFYKA